VQAEPVGVNGRGVAGVCRDRNRPEMTGRTFIYIWEYEVAPGWEAEFLPHYASGGSWTRPLLPRGEDIPLRDDLNGSG
jgi:hypothetical protein